MELEYKAMPAGYGTNEIIEIKIQTSLTNIKEELNAYACIVGALLPDPEGVKFRVLTNGTSKDLIEIMNHVEEVLAQRPGGSAIVQRPRTNADALPTFVPVQAPKTQPEVAKQAKFNGIISRFLRWLI